VSVPGVYAGFIHGFLFGDIFEKGLTIKTGQTHVQHYMPELLASTEDGWLRPEAIITHRLPLDQAAEGYRIFNEKRENCRKVVLTT
jgi:threonine dehydrogenase-like Zn-dependent dehydrogenase